MFLLVVCCGAHSLAFTFKAYAESTYSNFKKPHAEYILFCILASKEECFISFFRDYRIKCHPKLAVSQARSTFDINQSNNTEATLIYSSG